ncbi:MAG TPA: ATP-binding protein [Aquabacterium sp.]|uniref:ATP-binding protein n=1 Tax=Aquabacterium sp. TaxID=1872578 RepID=UPI002E337425|nr:ATP-binding protein [Aquabacterium sp.]HEX5374090.1 ATP-binding protein [Aquabacterium sp.]
MSSSLDPALQQLVATAQALVTRLDALLPSPHHAAVAAPDWSASVAFRYRKRSTAAWASGWLEPVRHVAVIRYEDLQEVDTQKERFARNLAQFVSGQTANNVLLSGARGTGKSSLVKAGLQAHAAQGLRLIEVDKADMIDVPDLIELVSSRPERFVIYCDDLSFDEGEPGYKALKSVLDGTVSASGDNVLIVATSNRRHLLPEYHSDNKTYKHTDDGELHPGEVVEEKISLSERFGLWISFYPFSQDEYLAIVAQWLQHFGLDAQAIEAARPQALVWALERGSRSGRVAYQFARDQAGRHASERAS